MIAYPLSNGKVSAKPGQLQVADHKAFFFLEKDADGNVIDYKSAVTGNLRIVPEGTAREALQEDYTAMIGDGMMLGESLAFGQLMQACSDIQERLNQAAKP